MWQNFERKGIKDKVMVKREKQVTRKKCKNMIMLQNKIVKNTQSPHFQLAVPVNKT